MSDAGRWQRRLIGVIGPGDAARDAVGGLTVGILPADDVRDMSPHVEIAIAAGMGEARNVVIVHRISWSALAASTRRSWSCARVCDFAPGRVLWRMVDTRMSSHSQPLSRARPGSSRGSPAPAA